MGGGGGSQRLLCLNPTTVMVVLLLGLWLLLGCDNTNREYSNLHSEVFIFTMKSILIISFVVSLLPYISNGRRKQREVVFTEEEILSSTSSRKGLPKKRIKNPDFYGQLPNQVFVVVSKKNTSMGLEKKCLHKLF